MSLSKTRFVCFSVFAWQLICVSVSLPLSLWPSMFLALSVCMSACLSVFLCVCPSFASAYMPSNLTECPTVSLPVCLLRLSAFVSMSLSLSLTMYLSLYFSVYVSPSVFLYVSLWLCQTLFLSLCRSLSVCLFLLLLWGPAHWAVGRSVVWSFSRTFTQLHRRKSRCEDRIQRWQHLTDQNSQLNQSP